MHEVKGTPTRSLAWWGCSEAWWTRVRLSRMRSTSSTTYKIREFLFRNGSVLLPAMSNYGQYEHIMCAVGTYVTCKSHVCPVRRCRPEKSMCVRGTHKQPLLVHCRTPISRPCACAASIFFCIEEHQFLESWSAGVPKMWRRCAIPVCSASLLWWAVSIRVRLTSPRCLGLFCRGGQELYRSCIASWTN